MGPARRIGTPAVATGLADVSSGEWRNLGAPGRSLVTRRESFTTGWLSSGPPLGPFRGGHATGAPTVPVAGPRDPEERLTAPMTLNAFDAVEDVPLVERRARMRDAEREKLPAGCPAPRVPEIAVPVVRVDDGEVRVRHVLQRCAVPVLPESTRPSGRCRRQAVRGPCGRRAAAIPPASRAGRRSARSRGAGRSPGPGR